MMRIVRTLITPEFAKLALEKSFGNRSITKTHVDELVKAITSGKWTESNDLICFDTNGMFTNGHHRMYAVIKANIPVYMNVAYDMPPEATPNYDNGRTRSLADNIKIYNQGAKYSRKDASLGKMLFCINNAKERLTATSLRNALNNTKSKMTEICQYITDNIDDIEDTVLMCERLRVAQTMLERIGLMVLIHQVKARRNEAEAFAEKVLNGLGLEKDSPQFALRNYMLKTSYCMNGQIVMSHDYAASVKAWNMYRTGKTCKFIRLPDDEEIQSLILF